MTGAGCPSDGERHGTFWTAGNSDHCRRASGSVRARQDFDLMGEVGKGITAFKKGVKDSATEIEAASADTAKDVTPKVQDADKDKA